MDREPKELLVGTTVLILFAVAILYFLAYAAVVYALNVWYRDSIRDGEWHKHYSIFCGNVMRRFVSGEWQYRPFSKQEAIDDVGERNW